MTSLPGKPVSLWLDSPAPPRRPPFTGSGEADVVVVGGGIVGVTCALHLAERGLSVVLVEAREVAGGITGRSTAKVTALHETQYSHIARRVGREAAQAYAESNLQGVARVAELVAEHGIACDMERAPCFLYTEEEAEVPAVEAECAAAVEAGLPAEPADTTELPFATRAAVRLTEQMALDSAALTRGLAAAAERAGARICEGSRVRSIGHGRPCRVELEGGASLTAERVVVATLMPLLDRGLHFARMRPQASHAVAGPVAGAPRGMYLGIGSATRSIRSAPAPGGGRRLIVGGEGHKVGHADGADAYRTLAEWADDRFGLAQVEHRWSAHDMMSSDELPLVGRLAPWTSRVLTATGFGKWGLAKGVSAADILCGEILGEPDPKREVFDPARLNVRAQLPGFVRENLDVGFQFFAGRLRRGAAGSLDPGQGRIVGEGLRQTAVCRDLDGTLHRLSARCTHLGCIVRWNEGDATWDCPCHGSRFAADGTVIEGPASAPLPPQQD